MNKKSLLFIESPLQLLNAYEGVSYFNLDNYEYIVRLSNNTANDRQIINLLKLLKVNNRKVKYIYLSSSNRTFYDYIKIFFHTYKYMFMKDFDKIFIGNYNSGFFKLIIKQFEKSKIILLDDGAKTLSIQSKFTDIANYNWFTMYKLKPLKDQKIYNNNYKKTLSKIKDFSINHNEIIFLGSKLSESGIISEEYYIKLLQSICNYYNNKKLVYIVHRGESQKKIELIRQNSNFTIRELNYPVELYGLYEKEIPGKVASFYSTALLTMKKIYGLEAESFYLDFSNYKYKDSIKKVYEYYKNELKVINLND